MPFSHVQENKIKSAFLPHFHSLLGTHSCNRRLSFVKTRPKDAKYLTTNPLVTITKSNYNNSACQYEGFGPASHAKHTELSIHKTCTKVSYSTSLSGKRLWRGQLVVAVKYKSVEKSHLYNYLVHTHVHTYKHGIFV